MSFLHKHRTPRSGGADRMFDLPWFALVSPVRAFDALTLLPGCQRANTATAL
jgi:hypothetical protein